MIDRRILLAGLAAAPLTACAAGPGTEAAGSSLKLVTFNIWHNQGDWAARQPLLIAAIRAANPDVIALQEVLEDAAEGLPRRYGNAILSRLPVLAHDWKKLEPLDDYRTAVRIRVDVAGRPVDIVNTHLAWQDDAQAVRARQIADLMAWLPKDGTPLIVMGDFNAVQEDAGLAALTGERFFSALPRGSVPTTLNPAKGHPPRVIDHIFPEAARFAPASAAVIGSEPTDGEYPSD